MAALNRPTKATYEIHEHVTANTLDNEDHTFCGIMFPVKCKDLLPIDHLVIKSVAVRGRLGPLTVWVSNEDQHVDDNGGAERRVRLAPRYWTKLYDKEHPSSRRELTELVLSQPIKLRPGETRVIYIHSTLPGDEAIVYDNSYYDMTSKRYEDDKLAILTGRAHVSNEIFGQEPIWGWGNAWRDRREFVGRLEYGTVYKLWNPQVQCKFGSNFQDGARSLFLCQRRWESPMSILPDECIYYILNMCRWDWFSDTPVTLRQRRKREKLRVNQARDSALRREAEADAMAVRTTGVSVSEDMEAEDVAGTCAARCKEGSHSTLAHAVGGDDDHGDGNDEDVNLADEEDEEMEDEEWDDDDNEEEDDGDDDEDEDWSDDEGQYHNANIQQFSFRDYDSDDSSHGSNEEQTQGEGRTRREWIRRQFARIHVLRALAHMQDEEVS